MERGAPSQNQTGAPHGDLGDDIPAFGILGSHITQLVFERQTLDG